MTGSRKVLSLDVGKLTELGSTRQHLVDSLGFYKPNDPDLLLARGEMFIVADSPYNDEAHALATRTATEVIIKKYFHRSASPDIEASLRNAFGLANMRIFEQNEDRNTTIYAGASVTCAVVQKGTLHVAHIGNCRLYLLKGNSVQLLTNDTPDDAQSSQNMAAQPVVPGLLGKTAQIDIAYFKRSLRPNDMIFMCTDGIYQNFNEREIASIALKYSPQVACEQYIATAAERANRENATVILVKINGLEAVHDEMDSETDSSINLMQKEDETTTETTYSPDDSRAFSPVTIPIYNPIDEKAFEDEVSDNTEPEPEISQKEYARESTEDKSELNEGVFNSEPEPHLPEEVEPAEAPLQPDPPRFRTPTPPPKDIRRVNPEMIMTARSKPPQGLKRRRTTPDSPKKKINYQKYLPIAASFALALSLSALILYVLIHENEQLNLNNLLNPKIYQAKTDSTLDSLDFKPMAELPAPHQSEPIVEKPVEVQAGAAHRATLPPVKTGQLLLQIIHGQRMEQSRIQEYTSLIESAKIPNLQSDVVALGSSNFQRSKLLYRFPEDGNSLQVRNAALQVQDIITQKYNNQIEIIRNDVTIIIGKDLDMNKIKVDQFKRKILDTNYSAPIHVEILNGSGTPKLANRLQKSLDELLIDDNNFIQVIDARNADHFKYAKTILKCRTAELERARAILTILNLPLEPDRISNTDLADIQLVMGEDFPKY